MSIHSAIEDMGCEGDDGALVVSEYWPSESTEKNRQLNRLHASSVSEPKKVSWWEQTNWFRVQERRQLEQQFEAQQIALGRPMSSLHSPINTVDESKQTHPAAYTVTHPLHDDNDAAVEYGGIGEDGAQLGDRYMGKAHRGIGSNIGQGKMTNDIVPSLTEQQRVANAPGGAEVFCRFNSTPRTPVTTMPPVAIPAVALSQTSVAVAKAAVQPSIQLSTTAATPTVNIPSLMARSDSHMQRPASAAVTKPASTKVRLASIAGYDKKVKRELHELVVLPLFHPHLFSSLGVKAARGIVLAGCSGSGKTELVKSLVHELGHRVYFQHVDAAHLLTELSTDLAAHKAADPRNMESTLGIQNSGTGLGAPQECGSDVLSKLFATCRKNAPALLFIDELDVVASAPRQGEVPLHAKIRALLKLNLDRLSEWKGAPVIVIGATNHPESIDIALQRTGRFDRTIHLHKPDEGNRFAILQTAAQTMRMDPTTREKDLRAVASKTDGFVGSDLANLCTEAGLVCIRQFLYQHQDAQSAGTGMDQHGDDISMQYDDSEDGVTPVPSPSSLAADAASLDSIRITLNHFLTALQTIRPAASMTFGTEALTPIRWSDVGGTNEIKDSLLETIEAPLLHPKVYEKFGLAPSSGVLLYGPPGCGESSLPHRYAFTANF
jgi:SpoVK/Ycf46/Vps4 family AAA+-type ATPase